MALPQQFVERLSLPVIAVPMFLASNPLMVSDNSKAGTIGTFPAAVHSYGGVVFHGVINAYHGQKSM